MYRNLCYVYHSGKEQGDYNLTLRQSVPLLFYNEKHQNLLYNNEEVFIPVESLLYMHSLYDLFLFNIECCALFNKALFRLTDNRNTVI